MSSPKTESKRAVRAYILAGGYSSRFGTDKARHIYLGEPLIMHVARSIAEISDSVTVVADKPGKFDALGLETIADSVPHTGPMGGLLTALGYHPDPGWSLILSCDMIGLRSHWIETLISASTDSRYKAVAYSDGKPQPFPGLYHSDICAEAYNTNSISHLLEQCGNLLRVPPDWHLAANINRPTDLPSGCEQ